MTKHSLIGLNLRTVLLIWLSLGILCTPLSQHIFAQSDTFVEESAGNTVSLEQSVAIPQGVSLNQFGSLETRNAEPVTVQKPSATLRNTSMLKITHFQIDDDSVSPSKGNGNGILESGEVVQVGVTIKNVSSQTQDNLVLHLQSPNSQLTIQNPTVELGSIQSGATWKAYNMNFVVVASTAIQPNVAADLEFFTTQSGQEMHREKFVANLNSPYLVNSIADSWYSTNSFQADMDMAYDSRGEAYAVWRDSRYHSGDGDILFAKTINGGYAFSEPIVISTTRGYVNATPKIVVNNQDEVVITWVYQSASSFQYDIYSRFSSDRGSSFSDAVRVTAEQASYYQYEPRFTTYTLGSHNDNVYVVWPTDLGGQTHYSTLNLSTSVNNGASYSASLLPNMPQPGTYMYPYLDAKRGDLLLSYLDRSTLRAYVMRSSDAGQTFSAPREFPTVDDAFHSIPRAFIDDAGVMQLVWAEQPTPMNFAYYANSTDYGQTYNFAQRIHDTTYGFAQDVPALVSINTKQLVATYGELHSDGLSVFHSSNSGESFSDRVRLTSTNVNDFVSNRHDITQTKSSAVPYWEDYDLSQYGSPVSSLSYGETGQNVQTIGLGAGWNYLALQVDPFEDITAETILRNAAAQGNHCDQVARWDTVTANWQVFPQVGNFNLENYRGYFMRCSEYGNYLLRGEPLAFSVQNIPGLYDATVGLVSLGVPVNGQYSAQSLCATIANNSQKECVLVHRWEQGGWDSYVPNININNFDIRSGRGYMVQLKMKKAKALPIKIKPLP